MEEVSTIEKAADQPTDVSGAIDADADLRVESKPSKPTLPKKTKAAEGPKGKVGKTPSVAKKDSLPKVAKPAAAPWTFPKATLEEAIKIARAIEEQNAGNPMKPDVLAKAVGYKAVADWRFLDLLRAANQYGLGSGPIDVSAAI